MNALPPGFMDGILAECAAKGAALGHALRESRAAFYERRPEFLDQIPGLAAWSTPEQIIAVCDAFEDDGRVDFVRPANIAGAKLYAQRQIAAGRRAA